MIGAFGISGFFAYLANSPFVLIDHYGLTPRQYSLAFAVNAASFIGASQFTATLVSRWGMVRVVKFAVTGYAVVMLSLLVLYLLGVDRLDVLIIMMLAGFGFLGLVLPTTAVLALEAHGAISGTASALMGTLQFITSAIVMAAVGLFVDTSARAMVTGIAGCALVTWILARCTLGPGTVAHPHPHTHTP
jgi:DHA1 family bicyclomycin/chloramphenicol resistance-like MFS transporter